MCWYDRRADTGLVVSALLRRVDRSPFVNFIVNPSFNVPTHGNDGVVNPAYPGDYDGLTSDFLKAPVFIRAFITVTSGANPDVKAVSFQ